LLSAILLLSIVTMILIERGRPGMGARRYKDGMVKFWARERI